MIFVAYFYTATVVMDLSEKYQLHLFSLCHTGMELEGGEGGGQLLK